MKRTIKLASLLLVLVMVLGVALCGCGAKDTDPANAVFVTLTNAGELGTAKDGTFIAARAVEVPAEGSTVGDVIIALHKNFCKDGEAGFATQKTDYGLSITKLWGVENGGAYGYYLNSNMCMSLDDPVKAGDRLDVFIYKDTAAYSDALLYLDAKAEGTTVTATVNALGFDANYNLVAKALEGTKIYYVNGKKLVDTKAVTNAEGVATFTLKAGTYRLVAVNTDGTYTVSAQKIVITK